MVAKSQEKYNLCSVSEVAGNIMIVILKNTVDFMGFVSYRKWNVSAEPAVNKNNSSFRWGGGDLM